MTIGTISQIRIMCGVCEKVKMVTFSDLYAAYKKCKKNKSTTINAIKFEVSLTDNLWRLHDEINSFSYKPSHYVCFKVHSPKAREVFASDFRDRVVHHLLISDLEPLFEPLFIYDSYSCRVNKGTHRGVKRVQRFSRSEKSRYYLQLDIKNFFLSIDQWRLFEMIKKQVMKRAVSHKDRMLFLSNRIIFDDPTTKYHYKGDFRMHQTIPKHKSLFFTPKHKGLPIGNLTSQFFANVYLHEMDSYIKRVLKVRHYVRYVDDFILFGESKAMLLAQKEKISHFLEERLGLSLREKYSLKEVNGGIDFLGYIIRGHYILVRKRVVNNYKYKKAKFLESSQEGSFSQETYERFREVSASYAGHFKHANSYNLRRTLGIENFIKEKK